MRLSRGLGLASLGVVLVLLSSSLVAAGAGTPSAPVPAAPTGATYNVTFTESGLPAGTNWSVKLVFVGCGCDGTHGTFTTNGNTLTIAATNGSYRFTVLFVPGYFVNASTRGLVNVSGAAPAPVALTFHPIVTYAVEFTETGLPAGTNWTVSLFGNGIGQARMLEDQKQTTNNSSMNFSLLNANYRYTVSKVPGSYFLGPPHGTFVVANASPAPIAVAFVTPPTVLVSFHETGLTHGTNWTVRVAGWGGFRIGATASSTDRWVNFSLPNGTYRFTVGEVLDYVLAGAPVGHLVVTNTAVTENVTFTPLGPGAFYPVEFSEIGLPTGHHWHVLVVATDTFGHSRSTTQSANVSDLAVFLQNGTFRYQIYSVHGYTMNVSTGTFTVAGAAPAPIDVNFTKIPTYTVKVTESGLVPGTEWSVLVRTSPGGISAWPVFVTHSSNRTTITFQLPNGSYCFRIYAVPYYHVTSGMLAGSFTVTGGSPAVITIGFAPRA